MVLWVPRNFHGRVRALGIALKHTHKKNNPEFKSAYNQLLVDQQTASSMSSFFCEYALGVAPFTLNKNEQTHSFASTTGRGIDPNFGSIPLVAAEGTSSVGKFSQTVGERW